MTRHLAILLTFLSLCIISCSDVPCSKTGLQFGLVGFSDTESDTIIIRRYTQDATPVLKDTVLHAHLHFQRSQDSLKMVSIPGSAILESGYDYDIFFPQTGKLIRITDIIEEQRSMKPRGKVGCVNNIIGLTINGQPVVNVSDDRAWLPH